MHVEIDDGDALQAVMRQRMHRRHRDVVEETETHRQTTFRVMPRRTHGAKSVLDLARHDEIDSQDSGPSGTECRLPGVRIHGRIRIEMDDAMRRRTFFQACQVRCRMHAQQLLERRQRRLVMHQIMIHPLRDQMIIDRAQPSRALRIQGTHVVQETVAMGDVGCAVHSALGRFRGKVSIIGPTA